MTAPVAVFAYARPDHLRRTLASLAANTLASETQLIIFCDGPRSEEDAPRVRDVREVAEAATGFKSVEIRARDENVGLAANIIEGVTQVANAHGRVIVVEDDMVLAPGFLSFMNAALDRYADEPKVWHVSGWNYPIDSEGLPETFFWRCINCWGWATWADRWAHFQKDPDRLLADWNMPTIDRFTLDRAEPDFWLHVELNASGRMNTWAIFWYASVFENGGLCLSPTQSLVRNIGFDGSGEHCGDEDDASQAMALSDQSEWRWSDSMSEHAMAYERIRSVLQQKPRGSIRRRFRRRAALLWKYGSPLRRLLATKAAS
ncbi:MAG: glycosyltransferase [Pseudomonadota bacterium]